MCADIPIVVNQWATFNPSFVYDIDGVLVDLTGCTAEMQVRQNKAATAVLLTLTTADDSIVIDGPAGKITLDVSNVDTGALSFAPAVYDLLITFPSGFVQRLFAGSFTLSFGVTHP